MPLTQEWFENPPKAFRPWTVWWWFGSNTTEEDLRWELAQMDEHGIGGVEINPIYAMEADDSANGVQSLAVFSAPWRKRLVAALDEAEKRGMTVWMRGGSGWPFGGPWITPQLASKSVARAVLTVTGPQTWSGVAPKPLSATRWSNPILECVVAVNAAGERRVLEPRLNDGGRVSLDVPAGSWQLNFFSRMNTNMQVKRAGPGGAGLVMDHYSVEATDTMFRVLEPVLREGRQAAPNAFRGIAEDSLELDDDNWTEGFLASFEQRRGYDPRPYLPDLWEDTALSPGIRHDFLQTVSDLMVERHFGRMRELASRHGMQTMTEAHGSMTDTLRAYATADVPDGETIWQFKERHEVNVRNRRVASSAAHIYGKPVAAAESYTWLRQPRFLVKPWMVKAASDAIYLDGINQIRNHGYSSSPQRLKAPGNVFYASTLMNHNQTWWPHYPAVSAYVGRMNYVLQQGEPANDVLLYHNLWDGMADYKQPTPSWMAGDDAWHRRDINPGIDGSAQIAMRTKDVAEQLRRSCYGFDYINDHALAERGVPTRARVLVFNQTRYVPVATLRRLRDLVDKGFLLVSVGRLPEAGVGMKELQNPERRQEWKALFDDLWKTGKWWVVSDAYALSLWLDNHLGRDFDRDAAGETLGVVHRHDEDREIYFVSNGSEKPVSTLASVRGKAEGLELWDAEGGNVYALSTDPRSPSGRTAFQLELGPWQSAVVIAKPQPSMAPPAPRPVAFVEDGRAIELTDWELSRDGDDAVIPLPDGPVDWETIGPWRNYAGVGIYRASARIPSPGRDEGFRYLLDLGDLEVSAEVRVGDQRAGFVILPPWRIDITSVLYPGPVRIEIRVANLWSNAVKAMPPEPSKIPGPGYSVTDVLYGPTERPLQRSGLIGPVRLLQVKAG
jgi:hypothetical protein